MIYMSKDNTGVIISCDCGCDEGFRFQIDNSVDGKIVFVSTMNGNFMRDQDDKIASVIARKIRKIWAIIRNKDFYATEVILNKEDFDEFKRFINSV